MHLFCNLPSTKLCSIKLLTAVVIYKLFTDITVSKCLPCLHDMCSCCCLYFMEDLSSKFQAVSEGNKYNAKDCVCGFKC